MRQNHAEGFAHAIAVLALWVVFPSLAVLAGGALSLVCSAVAAIRRSFADRRAEPPQPNATTET